MQNVSTLLQNIKPGETSAERPQKRFDQETIDATQYFFARLKMVYGASKFDAYWPTDTDVKMVKREWAESIAKLTKQEMDSALDNAKRQMHDPEWSWPNIGLILSGASRYATAAHRPFLPEPSRDIPPAHERHARASEILAML